MRFLVQGLCSIIFGLCAGMLLCFWYFDYFGKFIWLNPVIGLAFSSFGLWKLRKDE